MKKDFIVFTTYLSEIHFTFKAYANVYLYTMLFRICQTGNYKIWCMQGWFFGFETNFKMSSFSQRWL